eukprot:2864891-Karenia_brevis.AAC.1
MRERWGKEFSWLCPELKGDVEVAIRDTHDLIIDFRTLEDRLVALEKESSNNDSGLIVGQLQAGLVQQGYLTEIRHQLAILEMEIHEFGKQCDSENPTDSYDVQLEELDGSISQVRKEVKQLGQFFARVSGSEPPPWAAGFFQMLQEVQEIQSRQLQSFNVLSDA